MLLSHWGLNLDGVFLMVCLIAVGHTANQTNEKIQENSWCCSLISLHKTITIL